VLNDATCKAAEPREGAYRLADGRSLFLIVRSSGAKSWEFRWKRGGQVRGVVIGPYPRIGLAKARKERDRLKGELAKGLDPLAQKALAAAEERRKLAELNAEKARERAELAAKRITFARVAGEWLDYYRKDWTSGHAEQVEQSLRDHVFPEIGARRLDTIGTGDVLRILDAMLADGKLETAQRIKQRMQAVFEYAAPRYHVTADPVSLVRRDFAKRLRIARKARPVEKFSVIPLKEVPSLLRALRAYTGPAVRLVRWIALTATRTGEARRATWEEIDREAAEWRIPAEKMKSRREHVVIMSRQTLELLDEIPQRSEFLFPNPRDPHRPASENAVLAVLAAVGFKDRMTGHGFRSLFSTAANESGLWRPDVIEVSLAHGDEDKIRGRYNDAEYLDERQRLMQWWGDELARLEAGGPTKVRAIRGGKRA
jgi:integrase